MLYTVVGIALLLVLDPATLARSSAPLAEAAHAGELGWVAPAARVGAAVASLGALLGLITGIGRTTLAMARNYDLPQWLAAVHPRYQVPHHAEIALAVVACALVLTLDLCGAIGFSSFGVLVYYAIANAAAYTLPPEQRHMRRWLPTLGLILHNTGRHPALDLRGSRTGGLRHWDRRPNPRDRGHEQQPLKRSPRTQGMDSAEAVLNEASKCPASVPKTSRTELEWPKPASSTTSAIGSALFDAIMHARFPPYHGVANEIAAHAGHGTLHDNLAALLNALDRFYLRIMPISRTTRRFCGI